MADKINKKFIAELLDSYSVKSIEGALTDLYIKNLDISNVNSEFLRDIIKIDEKEKKEIQDRVSIINEKPNLKIIERIFELMVGDKDRKLNGAFYTPEYIVNYILGKTLKNNCTVCDPSCGSGAFLTVATQRLHETTNKSIVELIENNIYGVDILDYNTRRTKIILSLLALKNSENPQNINFNIITNDSLNLDWQSTFEKVFEKGGFDSLVGNPPYIKIQDFKPGLKEKLINDWKTINKGNFNLYIPFFELGVKLLNNQGVLGYITPNNYFTSLAGEGLRLYLQENKLLKEILDFNHLSVFDDVLSYTCITLLSKSEKQAFDYKLVDGESQLNNLSEIKSSKIKFSDLNYKKWRLLSGKDLLNVKSIENIGKPLGRIARINVGIATLSDKLYFVDGNKVSGDYFLKEYNSKEFPIEKAITRKIIKISEIDEENDLKDNKKRIIFPYIVKKQGTVLDGKKSSKMVEILREEELKVNYPKCYEYLLTIKSELEKRDKGKKNYPIWYAYGRSQGLDNVGKKLLTKTFSNKPNFFLEEDEDSLFCNGYAVIYNNPLILKKILNSAVMDYYVKKTSFQIEGNYQCYQKNFIEMFNIPSMTKEESDYLSLEQNQSNINKFLFRKYNLSI